MTDKIILACVAIFMPLAILVINKLLDRTTIKEKDNTINDLLTKVSNLTTEKTTSAKSESIAKQASAQTAQLAKEQLQSTKSEAEMTERAKNIKTLEEALELARQQVENTK